MLLLLAVGVAIVPAVIILSFPLHAAWLFHRNRRDALEPHPRPRISVIIPCRGIEENTATNVAALLAQESHSWIEFIFCVEDMSDAVVPPLREAIERSLDRQAAAVARHQPKLIATGAARGLGKMHNLLGGVAEAIGDCLVFMDSDVQLDDPRYLEKFVADLSRPAVGLVTCFPAYRGAESIAAAVTAMMINNDLLGYFAILGAWKRLDVANGSCMAMTRDMLQELGGLEGLRNQLLMDTSLAQRVVALGRRVHLHERPAPVVRRSMTWQEWWQQSHRWQASMWRVLPRLQYVAFAWLRSATAVATLALVAASFDPVLLVSLGIILCARLASAWVLNAFYIKNPSFGRFAWLMPPIEVINSISSIAAVFVSRVTWRGDRYRVLKDGSAVRIADRAENR